MDGAHPTKGEQQATSVLHKHNNSGKLFSLVDCHKVYNYWFKQWNLNLEEYEDFYLTQLGIKNGSVIEIDDVNEGVFSEDFLHPNLILRLGRD